MAYEHLKYPKKQSTEENVDEDNGVDSGKNKNYIFGKCQYWWSKSEVGLSF